MNRSFTTADLNQQLDHDITQACQAYQRTHPRLSVQRRQDLDAITHLLHDATSYPDRLSELDLFCAHLHTGLLGRSNLRYRIQTVLKDPTYAPVQTLQALHHEITLLQQTLTQAEFEISVVDPRDELIKRYQSVLQEGITQYEKCFPQYDAISAARRTDIQSLQTQAHKTLPIWEIDIQIRQTLQTLTCGLLGRSRLRRSILQGLKTPACQPHAWIAAYQRYLRALQTYQATTILSDGTAQSDRWHHARAFTLFGDHRPESLPSIEIPLETFNQKDPDIFTESSSFRKLSCTTLTVG